MVHLALRIHFILMFPFLNKVGQWYVSIWDIYYILIKHKRPGFLTAQVIGGSFTPSAQSQVNRI